jgi:poly(beta-D-mannuronate) lyase
MYFPVHGWLLLLPILVLHIRSAAADPDGEVREALASAGVKDPLRYDLQRPIDLRLLKIESVGLEKSGLGLGKVHTVRNAHEINALSGKLAPGDQLVLAGNDWKDAHLKFEGQGTPEAPILVYPEHPGGVVFTGISTVAFSGSHLIICGLEFRNVAVAKSNDVIFRLGNGKNKPAAHCIVTHLRMENCGSPSPEDWPKVRVWLMNVIGPANTVAHSTFSGFRNIGQMIGAADLPPDSLQQLHILDCQFLNRPYIDEQNGYEILQLGWSEERAKSSGSLIQSCTFENCDGENEIITLKASDVFVRHNVFRGCQGVLNLRECNRVLVQRNLFDGHGRKNTGGIGIEGADHIIVDNTFRNLRGHRNYYFWTIMTICADGENAGDSIEGYGRPKNILIAKNRFDHNEGRIAIGVYPREKYPLLPRNIIVRDNTFIGTNATTPFDYLAPDPTNSFSTELHSSGNSFTP